MNVLLSMPNDQQSNNYIINALQDLGHEVIYIDHRVHLEECYKIVPIIFKEAKIDLFLCLYLVPNRTYSVDFIQIMKAHYPNIKYCAWLFDVTVGDINAPQNEELIKILKEYDYFFTTVRGQVEEFKDKGINAYFMPEGFDSYTYDFSGKMPYKYDVSFIGQLGHPLIHKERLPLLKKIINKFNNVAIFGQLFQSDKDILLFHKRRPTFNDVEHSKIVAQSKINLCQSGWGDIDGYFSARNYRIMGSGGFCLANHSKGIEDFFEIDKEIATYKSEAECLEKIQYYLVHEEERNKIRLAGQKRVIKDYLFYYRLEELLKIVV